MIECGLPYAAMDFKILPPEVSCMESLVALLIVCVVYVYDGGAVISPLQHFAKVQLCLAVLKLCLLMLLFCFAPNIILPSSVVLVIYIHHVYYF